MEIGKLVLLQYIANARDINITDVEEAQERNPDLEIDLKKKTWSYEKIKDVPIGKKRDLNIYLNGPIGIYDRTNIIHLNQMMQDSYFCKEFIKDRNGRDISMDLGDD